MTTTDGSLSARGIRRRRPAPRPAAVVALAGAALLAAAPGARAQMDSREGIALQNQILELRHEIEVMREQGGRGGDVLAGRPSDDSGGGGGGDMVPQLLSRVQALEEQNRALQGRVDELQNAQQRQYQDLAKQIGDLSFKLSAQATPAPAPSYAPPAAPAYPPPAPARPEARPESRSETAAPSAAPATLRPPERSIAEAQAALARRDYAAAEAAAREVLQTNRTSPRAYDAQFLLAEALSGRRDYAQAAIAYDDAYNRSKTGVHAPEALVGLAASLAAIGEKRAACETLAKLGHEFPSARGGVRDGAAAVRQRAACS